MTKLYMVNHPRPYGIDPIAYKEKPTFELDDDNWFIPEIIEFNTELEARKFVKKYYPNLYKEFDIKDRI